MNIVVLADCQKGYLLDKDPAIVDNIVKVFSSVAVSSFPAAIWHFTNSDSTMFGSELYSAVFAPRSECFTKLYPVAAQAFVPRLFTSAISGHTPKLQERATHAPCLAFMGEDGTPFSDEWGMLGPWAKAQRKRNNQDTTGELNFFFVGREVRIAEMYKAFEKEFGDYEMQHIMPLQKPEPHFTLVRDAVFSDEETTVSAMAQGRKTAGFVTKNLWAQASVISTADVVEALCGETGN